MKNEDNKVKIGQNFRAQDQKWKRDSRKIRPLELKSPKKCSPKRANSQLRSLEGIYDENVKVIDEHVDEKLYSPKMIRNVTEDDRKKAFDDEMKILGSKTLKMI